MFFTTDAGPTTHSVKLASLLTVHRNVEVILLYQTLVEWF